MCFPYSCTNWVILTLSSHFRVLVVSTIFSTSLGRLQFPLGHLQGISLFCFKLNCGCLSCSFLDYWVLSQIILGPWPHMRPLAVLICVLCNFILLQVFLSQFYVCLFQTTYLVGFSCFSVVRVIQSYQGNFTWYCIAVAMHYTTILQFRSYVTSDDFSVFCCH